MSQFHGPDFFISQVEEYHNQSPLKKDIQDLPTFDFRGEKEPKIGIFVNSIGLYGLLVLSISPFFLKERPNNES